MPCDYRNYPKNWKAIRAEIVARAKNQCEWDIGSTDKVDLRCPEQHGSAGRHFKGMVVLTIAHLCHKTKCARRKHLMAMCQLHHNRYDAKHRAANRKKTIMKKRRLEYA